MTSLDRTRALIADLARALGLAELPPDNDNGYKLIIRERTLSLYGSDDESILLVAPLVPLPTDPGYGLTAYLLRKNLFQSDIAPFQVALENAGNLLIWGRLAVADLDGPTLAAVLNRLAERAAEMAGEIEKA
jgi:hypothetical protein